MVTNFYFLFLEIKYIYFQIWINFSIFKESLSDELYDMIKTGGWGGREVETLRDYIRVYVMQQADTLLGLVCLYLASRGGESSHE